ncbi:hypothetical protein TraAM80_05646 [Trypanosoma rangeli]|uniref:Uncharacterized protein n=1 Tax=Trypanosoma rangeli TaxID=5698 RepID=A0A422NDC9_TRYRA|nr:uncharacterized protein TraAM80_05646 [Trypanosoma rangeli]RNF03485.1 hypothetical protein TraAM80_05646 [Trypanosoma rangeli]|eukprot:RNF03485.1 hypothetical protein TraAM80_05646 [Trypanosoma rangeli]
MPKHFCAWRGLRKVDATVITMLQTYVSVVTAVQHRSLTADVRATSHNDSGAGPATATDAVRTTTTAAPQRPEMGQLLQQLLWRAKEALLMGAARTEVPQGAGRGRKWSREPGTSQPPPPPRIHPADATGLFEVEWSELTRPTQKAHDGLFCECL